MGKQYANQERKKRWLRCLGREVAVEYKACLYFFAILFFYACYLMAQGIYAASLLHMLEMILATYGMGYLQVLVLDNFDEAERFSAGQCICILLCSCLYTGIGYLFAWFDRRAAVTVGFLFYCIFLYICAWLANKAKRYVDTEELNEMLQRYQSRKRKDAGKQTLGSSAEDSGNPVREETTRSGILSEK